MTTETCNDNQPSRTRQFIVTGAAMTVSALAGFGAVQLVVALFF